MLRAIRIILFIILVLSPFVLYKTIRKHVRAAGNENNVRHVDRIHKKTTAFHDPKIALIFEGLGGTLKDLKEIQILNVPATLSIIPGLKFSKNIANIGLRYGFSIFINIPLQDYAGSGRDSRYQVLTVSLTDREILSLLRYQLNEIRSAIGVNNFTGDFITENKYFMHVVLRSVKQKGLIFVDSRSSSQSVAYDVARDMGLTCGYNEGFLDANDDVMAIERTVDELVEKAKIKGKIIVVAHCKKNTMSVLRRRIPALRQKIEFITMKEYFEL